MKLSIIMPVFNEEKTVRLVLEKLESLELPGTSIEVIVVDDGSVDKTRSILQKLKKGGKHFTLILHEKNLGKGAALRTGLEKAEGEYVLIQDADLEYNPDDIHTLLRPIQEKKSQVVYGTRLNRLPNLSRDERTSRFLVQYIGNKFLSLVTSLLYYQWITDMETGYKLFPRAFLKQATIHARSFDFEPEITAKLMKSGYKILEVPISTNPRGEDEGKKLVAMKDGPVALWTLIKYRFTD